MTGFLIRPFEDRDAAAAARIYFDAVQVGAIDHYDQQQRDAWAESIPDTEFWRTRLRSQHTLIAEINAQLIGYMSLDNSGYIDLAFVTPAWIGKGVAKALYRHLEELAIQNRLEKLTTEASHMARTHFERQGWSVVKKQTVRKSHGVTLENFGMEKKLR